MLRRIIIDKENILEYSDNYHNKWYVKNFCYLKDKCTEIGSTDFTLERKEKYSFLRIKNSVFLLHETLKDKSASEIASLGTQLFAYHVSLNLQKWVNYISLKREWMDSIGVLTREGKNSFIDEEALRRHYYHSVLDILLNPSLLKISFIGTAKPCSPIILFNKCFIEDADKRIILHSRECDNIKTIEFVKDKLRNDKKYEDKIIKIVKEVKSLKEEFPNIKETDLELEYENYYYNNPLGDVVWITIKDKNYQNNDCDWRDLDDIIIYQEKICENLGYDWRWCIGSEKTEHLLNVFQHEYRGVTPTKKHWRGYDIIRTVWGKDGFAVIDDDNNIIVPFGKYDFIDGFEKGYARVKHSIIYSFTSPSVPRGKDLWGLINQKGEEVLPVIYDDIWNFYGRDEWTTKVVLDGENKVFNLYFGIFSDPKYWDFKPIEAIERWFKPMNLDDEEDDYDAFGDLDIMEALDGCAEAAGNIEAGDPFT